MPTNIQSHIHLSKTLQGSPEFSPDTKWRVTERQEVPEVYLEVNRTLTGHLKKHVLTDASGNPQLFVNYRFVIRVSDYDGLDTTQRLNILKDMYGREVSFVDIEHPDDGEDHTSSVKPMFVRSVAEIKNLDPALQVFYVAVELTDNKEPA